MAKINIYAAGDRNWSAAAQRAFEIECNLVEVLMDTEDSVVVRLRASKASGGRPLSGCAPDLLESRFRCAA